MRRGFVLFARIEAFCSAVIVKQPSSDNTPYEKIGEEVHPLDTPFDIPESWEWIRFKDLVDYDLVDYSMGKRLLGKRRNIGTTVPSLGFLLRIWWQMGL